MADKKISELTLATPEETDVIPFVDISDTTMGLDGTTKKATKADLKGEKGDTGDTGATGATGATGSQGIQGEKGDKGDKGDTGSQGIQGETGLTGATGAAGTNGTDGDDAYVYIAYASADDGTGFTLTFDAGLDYIAVKNTTTAIASPVASDFTGLWKNYKGATGATGPAGAGSGDVLGPATHATNYIPQWNGVDTKTLKEGIPISTFASALGADDNYVTDAEKVVIGNTSGTNTGDNATNSQYSGLAASKQDVLTGLTTSVTELNYVDGVTSSIQTQLADKAPLAGWSTVSDSWTYASADAPSFVITVPSGAASIYTLGMRIKLTQTTVKYFIITKITDTTLTVYGGTDYTLVNAAISLVYYSNIKAPIGFPLSPTKWTVETRNTSNSGSGVLSAATWINTGNITISIPIGDWRVSYNGTLQMYNNGVSQGSLELSTTLSTANNSNSDVDFGSQVAWLGNAATITSLIATPYREKILSLDTKTTYYLNESYGNGTYQVYARGDLNPIIIKAVCTYL